MASALAEGPYGIATGAYVEERDHWPTAVGRARAEGWRWIELTAIRGRLAPLVRFLGAHVDALAPFERVSVHAPAAMAESPADVLETLQPYTFDVVLHPDVYGAGPSCAALGARAVFENMDVIKGSGRDVGDLADVFSSFPAAGFCLDVAHVWTIDPTLGLGHDLLDAFETRLRQLHVSGIEKDGTHRPTTTDDLALYRPLLERCPHVPWLLEAELVEDPV